MQVERSHRPVQRRADDHEAAGSEGDAGDAAHVLGEGDKAEATGGIPHLHLRRAAGLKPGPQPAGGERSAPTTHLPIIPSSDDVLSIRRVRQGGHVVKVALLLEDVGLALPLPHQQLTLA